MNTPAWQTLSEALMPLANQIPQVVLTKHDEVIQALGLDPPYPRLGDAVVAAGF